MAAIPIAVMNLAMTMEIKITTTLMMTMTPGKDATKKVVHGKEMTIAVITAVNGSIKRV
ncbi:hypothetical protein METHB2_350012 [Candidatus Methylobacter favarea]|uniref:Uncharacterized protein n=1 Tax=Candidatus Methylobacter favarea TaxID=2707345 RepID=A0A8S0Y6E0_9GAMM|nr:hypothetical protein METHB2_350012 [Candidatus Methylobacter favarea]